MLKLTLRGVGIGFRLTFRLFLAGTVGTPRMRETSRNQQYRQAARKINQQHNMTIVRDSTLNPTIMTIFWCPFSCSSIAACRSFSEHNTYSSNE